jgi:hypothetical protein
MTSLSETSILLGSSGVSTGFTIDQSVIFDAGSSSELQISNAPDLDAGAGGKLTYSFWLKRAVLGSVQTILKSDQNSDNYVWINIQSSDQLVFDSQIGGSSIFYLRTISLLRDPSAWYHIVLNIDTSQAVQTERVKIFLNGTRVTSLDQNNYPSLNQDIGPIYEHNNNPLYIGEQDDTGNFSSYYLAEFHSMDNYAYGPEYFGEFKENTNIWIPKEVSGVSYGTGGWYLNFSNASELGTDTSGAGNTFAEIGGLTASNQVLDSPTNNHGVFNYLEKDLRYSTTLTNGNKTITFPSGSTGYSGTRLGFFRSNGKAYAEFKVNQAFSYSSGDGIAVFVCDDTQDPVSAGGGAGSSKYEASYTAIEGKIYDGASEQGTGTTWNSVGAVIGVYVDFDSGKGWFSKDGTVQTVNGTPNVSNGTNPHFTFTANKTLTVGAGGVHYATVGIVTLQNHEDEWDTTPGYGYTPFSTKAEGEA